MKLDALIEWRRFEEALTTQLKATPLAEFKSVWSGKTDKTQYYKSKLLPEVAKQLAYVFQTEFLRCDYAILNSDRVPIVFIESENEHGTAFQEIDKLCAVGSPVKVLFISCDWADGERQKYLPKWKERIEIHHKYYDHNAIYMIIIGEWGRGKPKSDEILRYYIESLDVSGNEIGRKEIIIS